MLRETTDYEIEEVNKMIREEAEPSFIIHDYNGQLLNSIRSAFLEEILLHHGYLNIPHFAKGSKKYRLHLNNRIRYLLNTKGSVLCLVSFQEHKDGRLIAVARIKNTKVEL
jgi:hypothetical protein